MLMFVGVAVVATSASAFSASKHHLPHHHRKHRLHPAAKSASNTHVPVKKEGMIQSSSSAKIGLSQQAFCSDAPVDWKSKTGWTCEDYAKDKMCTEDGGQGEAWLKEWGSIKDWANEEGQSALNACCACGGGMEVEIHRSMLGGTCEDGEAIMTERECREAARLIGAAYALTAHWPKGQPSGCHVDGDGKTVWLNTSPHGTSPHPKYASLCAEDGKHNHPASGEEETEDGDDDDDDDTESEEEEREGESHKEVARIEGGIESSDSEEQEPTSSDEDPRTAADPETARLRKVVVKTHAALAHNMKRRVEVGTELKHLSSASSTDIDARVEALAVESKSPELAQFLGDMWKEQRHFEIPVYKEQLQSEYDQLEAEAIPLQAAYDAAKHELEARERRNH